MTSWVLTLVPGDRPALARQDDEAGLIDMPLDQAGGDDVGDNLLELVALDALRAPIIVHAAMLLMFGLSSTDR